MFTPYLSDLQYIVYDSIINMYLQAFHSFFKLVSRFPLRHLTRASGREPLLWREALRQQLNLLSRACIVNASASWPDKEPLMYPTLPSMYYHTCLCLCVHACVYVCMDVCLYVCMHVCIYVCIYVCMYVCMYVIMYACMYVCMCVFACEYM